MHDIFISYSRTDKEFAALLAGKLEEIGYKVWWDRKIPSGQTFDEVIEAAIDASKIVLVLWSEKSVESAWVRTEAAEGHRRNDLIPILIEDVKIPLAFRSVQAANLIGWEGDVENSHYQSFLTDMQNHLKNSGREVQVKKPIADAPKSSKKNAGKGPSFLKKVLIIGTTIVVCVFLIVLIIKYSNVIPEGSLHNVNVAENLSESKKDSSLLEADSAEDLIDENDETVGYTKFFGANLYSDQVENNHNTMHFQIDDQPFYLTMHAFDLFSDGAYLIFEIRSDELACSLPTEIDVDYDEIGHTEILDCGGHHLYANFIVTTDWSTGEERIYFGFDILAQPK